MVLNYIWISFFLVALVVGLVRLIVMGDTAIFTNMVNSTFETARTGFEISLGLTGVLTLWLGLMKVGEQGERSTRWRWWRVRSSGGCSRRCRAIIPRTAPSS